MAPKFITAISRLNPVDLMAGGVDSSSYTVGCEVPPHGFVVEATVARV